MANGLDGAYSQTYASLLRLAFFSDPITFAQKLSASGMTDALAHHAISQTAWDADAYPMELTAAIETLDEAIDGGKTFTQEQQGWAELLLLYLNTASDERWLLPQSPAEMTQ